MPHRTHRILILIRLCDDNKKPQTYALTSKTPFHTPGSPYAPEVATMTSEALGLPKREDALGIKLGALGFTGEAISPLEQRGETKDGDTVWHVFTTDWATEFHILHSAVVEHAGARLAGYDFTTVQCSPLYAQIERFL